MTSHKRIGNYIIHLKQLLGKGTYGQVCKGQDEITRKQCAVKMINKKIINSKQYLKRALIEEIQILQSLKHENIVEVYDVMQSPNNYYIIQELCDSDLDKYIKNNKLSQQQAIAILKQIVNGFIALTSEGIIHRDLKPANILISNGVMKLADFGFAKRHVPKKGMNSSSLGTPHYMSIQLLKGQPYSSKCDVWALGIIFYQMLHKKTPWTAKFSQFQLIQNIQSLPLLIDNGVKFDSSNFLKNTLAILQQDRISWDQVFGHEVFQGHFDKFIQQNKMIENKLKTIMGELRFKITSMNIQIYNLLQVLGFDPKEELTYGKFRQFIASISKEITQKEVRFFFDTIDENSNGTISIQEIQTAMAKHNAHKSMVKKGVTMKQLQPRLQQKAKKCFEKLFRILRYKKLSLRRLFTTYDRQGQGNMTFECFQKMIKGLREPFEQDQMRALFDFIDTDQSKTIQFDQIYSYYCKINGIPQGLEERVSEMTV